MIVLTILWTIIKWYCILTFAGWAVVGASTMLPYQQEGCTPLEMDNNVWYDTCERFKNWFKWMKEEP